MRKIGLRTYAPLASMPSMPQGLVELMEGLSRDVIKQNPMDLHEFCASHMKKLLEIRDARDNADLLKPHKTFTLEQKIAIAQNKVRERAEQRRIIYESKIAKIQRQKLSENEITKNKLFDTSFNVSKINKSEDKCESENNVNQEQKTDHTKKESDIFNSNKNEAKSSGVVDIENTTDNNYDANMVDVTDVNDQSSADTINVMATKKNDENKDDKTISSESSMLKVDVKVNDVIATEETLDTRYIIENEPASVNNIQQVDYELDLVTEEFPPKNTQNIEIICNENVTNSEAELIKTVPQVSMERIGNPRFLTQDTNIEEKNREVFKNLTLLKVSQESYENIIKQGNENFNEEEDSAKENVDGKIITGVHDEVSIGVRPMQLSDDKVNEEVFSTDKITILNTPETLELPNDNNINLSDNSGHGSNSEFDETEKIGNRPEKKDENIPTMDLETAAVTIQKVFRTFLFKSRASTLDEMSNYEDSVEAMFSTEDILSSDGSNTLKPESELHTPTQERRSLGITRMDTVLQTVNEEKSLSLSTDDSSTLSSAATTIQAHVRGFLVRNKFHSNKTTSNNSLVNSDGPFTSLEVDNENNKNKTVLNIHIVPEGGHYLSRDESIAMSLDLPLDNSPPSTTSLHQLGSDISERRKQLKREDAIQSISPPSNNSGKLSEDVDSVKEISVLETEVLENQNESDIRQDEIGVSNLTKDNTENNYNGITSGETTPSKSVTAETVIKMLSYSEGIHSSVNSPTQKQKGNLLEVNPDEMDVITPVLTSSENESIDSDNTSRLLHSSEFHDIVLPTNVIRNDSSVIRGE